MTASVIILVLLSALFHAFWNYLSKVSYSPQLFLAWVAIVNIAISIAVFLVRTPMIPSSIWVYIIASGIVHFFILPLLVKLILRVRSPTFTLLRAQHQD